MYCGSSLTRPSIVASLSRNGKILRASTLARVGLNQPTVTRHITLAAFKDVTASLRSDQARGGTLRISGCGCAARTLEPLAYTRASFSWILLSYTRVNSWFPWSSQPTGQFREK